MRLFEAIIDANHRAVAGDQSAGVHPADFESEFPIVALTCIDVRLNPLLPEVLGVPKEQFIWLRNAGNIITGPLSSTMRSLALACVVKGGKEIAIIGHTDCQVGKTTTTELIDGFRAIGVERHLLPANVNEFFGMFASERANVIKAVGIVRQSPLSARRFRCTVCCLILRRARWNGWSMVSDPGHHGSAPGRGGGLRRPHAGWDEVARRISRLAGSSSPKRRSARRLPRRKTGFPEDATSSRASRRPRRPPRDSAEASAAGAGEPRIPAAAAAPLPRLGPRLFTKDPSERSSPKAPPGLFLLRCITGLVLLVIVLGALMVGLHYVKTLVNRYTDTKPMELPAVQMSPEAAQVKERFESFQQAVRERRATKPLVLSADDINALITSGGEQQGWKGKVYVSLDGDQLKGELSVPLRDVGLSMFAGRYLNGSATFNLSFRDGRLSVTPQIIPGGVAASRRLYAADPQAEPCRRLNQRSVCGGSAERA